MFGFCQWDCRPYIPEEDVVDLLADVGSEAQQFSIDTVQDGLQVLPLPGVLAVKELQELQTQTHSITKHLQAALQLQAGPSFCPLFFA